MKADKPQGAFNQSLPEIGFLRLPQVLTFIPISKTALYDGIAEGRYPAPIKLGKRSSAWKVDDIRKLIEELGATS